VVIVYYHLCEILGLFGRMIGGLLDGTVSGLALCQCLSRAEQVSATHACLENTLKQGLLRSTMERLPVVLLDGLFGDALFCVDQDFLFAKGHLLLPRHYVGFVCLRRHILDTHILWPDEGLDQRDGSLDDTTRQARWSCDFKRSGGSQTLLPPKLGSRRI